MMTTESSPWLGLGSRRAFPVSPASGGARSSRSGPAPAPAADPGEAPPAAPPRAVQAPARPESPVWQVARAAAPVPLEWSGTMAGDFRPYYPTPAQHRFLESLRRLQPVTTVPPGSGGHHRFLIGTTGYTPKTVNSLLAHGLIRPHAEKGYTITDNGLHLLHIGR